MSTSSPRSMPRFRPVTGILKAAVSDTRLVSRDPLLAILPFAPLLASVAMRFILPLIDRFLLEETGFDLLGGYGLLIRAVLIEFPGMFYGMVGGFLILDDRDEGLLRYQEATPLGRSGYLAARLGFLSLCAFVSGPVCAWISNVGVADAGQAVAGLFGSKRAATELGVSFLGAFQVPFMALFLGAFAANKVEGLSISKALGVLDLAPLALVATGAARFSGAPFFQYWGVALLFRPASSGQGAIPFPYAMSPGLMFAAGTVIALIQVALLYRAFARRVE